MSRAHLLLVGFLVLGCERELPRAPTAQARQAVIGPEFPANPIGAGPQWESVNRPLLAWSGSQFLLVWADGRTGIDALYVTPVTSSGVALAPRGRRVWASPLSQTPGQLVCAGATCLLTWSTSTVTSTVAYALRLGADGTALDAAPQVLPAVGAIATNGAGFVLAWKDSGGGLVASRMTLGGVLLEPNGVPLAAGVRSVGGISAQGSDFTLSYETPTGVFGVWLGADGGTRAPYQVALDSYSPVVAASPTQALFAWETISGSWGVANATRLDANGTPLPPGEFLLNDVGATAREPYGLTIAEESNGYWIAWQYATGASHVSGARVTSAGGLLDVVPLQFDDPTGISYDPVVVCPADAGCLAAWANYAGDARVHLSRLQWDAGVLDRPNLRVPADTAAWAPMARPAVSCRGEECLVTWFEREGTGGIRATRVRRDAGVLDPTGLLVTTESVQYAGPPQLTVTPQGFFTAWSAGSFLSGAMIRFDGGVSAQAALIDGGIFGVTGEIGSDDTQAFVINSPSASTYDVLVSPVVAADPPRLASTRTIAMPYSFAESRKSLSDGTSPMLAVWNDRTGVQFSRIDPAGSPLDQPVVFIDGGRVGPVTVDPEGWLLFEPPPSAAVRRVWLDGGVGPEVPLAVPDGVDDLDVAFDGVAHVLTWTQLTATQRDVFVQYLTRDGVALGPPVALGSPDHAFAPSVSGTGNGAALLAYVRFDPSPGVLTRRVYLRWLDHLDAGVDDAGLDAGGDDGGGGADAGADAGSADAGSSDAGVPVGDGGSSSDGGAVMMTGRYQVGCGCTSAEGVLAAVALAWVVRRRGRVIGHRATAAAPAARRR